MYGPALQRADRRACHRQGLDPAPRVPHGVRRDGRGAIHRVPEERLLAGSRRTAAMAPFTSCAWTGGTWATCWPRVRPSIPSSREPVRLGERRTAAWAHSTAAGTNSFSCSGTAALPTATTCSSAGSGATAAMSGSIMASPPRSAARPRRATFWPCIRRQAGRGGGGCDPRLLDSR